MIRDKRGVCTFPIGRSQPRNSINKRTEEIAALKSRIMLQVARSFASGGVREDREVSRPDRIVVRRWSIIICV